MRIFQCISSLLGGGAERQLCYLAQGLVSLGHEVDVAYMVDGPFSRRLLDSGARAHRLGLRGRFDPTLVGDLCRLVGRTRAEVVQTWLPRTDVAGGAAARLLGRPWIYSERNEGSRPGWREAVRRRLLARADLILANSEGAAAAWRRRLGDPRRVEVVQNAVPLDEIDATPAADRAAWGCPPDGELVLYVGRFIAPKNVTLLGEALGELLQKRPRAVVVACGEGELRDGFRAALASRGVEERCRLPGFCDGTWSLMKAADLLVSPSISEGRPNAVLEAMACGCPLALSDIAPHRELADGREALFFAPTSLPDAVAAMARALDDRVAAADRARAAGERVSRLSTREVAALHVTHYTRLLEARPERAAIAAAGAR